MTVQLMLPLHQLNNTKKFISPSVTKQQLTDDKLGSMLV